jgi:hypothetical protein
MMIDQMSDSREARYPFWQPNWGCQLGFTKMQIAEGLHVCIIVPSSSRPSTKAICLWEKHNGGRC